MAYDPKRAGGRPVTAPVYDSTDPPFQWPGFPGGSWTPVEALPMTISLVTVHWEENPVPLSTGLSLSQAIRRAGQVAKYHHDERDWEKETPGLQTSDGIQYTWYIIDGYVLQVRPETKRTWNAGAANGHNIAICIAAGPRDTLNPKNVTRLEEMLSWYCYSRPDLPLVHALPQAVDVVDHSGSHKLMRSYGVLTHDETNALYGVPPKGCCGLYAPVVKAWRERQATLI